jgi:hypothetical protein
MSRQNAIGRGIGASRAESAFLLLGCHRLKFILGNSCVSLGKGVWLMRDRNADRGGEQHALQVPSPTFAVA